MSDFLLELRCEEIPARMQAGARAELEKLFRREMGAAGVATGDITVWSTPRRLALIARGLPEATSAVSEEAKGPPEGAPDAAIDGFCRKNGVTRDQLELRDVKGRNTWFAVIEKPGRATKDVLAEAIPAIVRDFSWPKSMRWGAASLSTESLRWVRPLSGVVALFNGEVVECEVDGIRSGRETLGHRFHHTGPIAIESAHTYASQLLDARVVVEHTKREELIRQAAADAASGAGLALVEDEGLVVENAGLTEYPVPLLGRFDEAFLDVPPEVIQLTARVNQKYFVLTESPPLGEVAARSADGGGAAAKTPSDPAADAAGPPPPKGETPRLANAFVCTANIAAEDGGEAIVDGNRKVLAARLSDARFFWELDRKTSLEDHAKKLERITFHEKLGTVADKVERVAKLARWLVESDIVTPDLIRGPASSGTAEDQRDPGSAAGVTKQELADLAEQAARLAKADLVTEMVGEFPELQGLMGGYYARAEGLPDAVADAIRDHYKPVGQGDEVPTAPVTVAVSFADKLDTIAGFFALKQAPTGSKDPFALRRSAIAVASQLFSSGVRLPLKQALEQAITSHVEPNVYVHTEVALLLTDVNLRQGRHDPELVVSGEYDRILEHAISRCADEIIDFFADRLKVQQREAGVRHDLIDAVFALGGEDDLVRLLARVKALQAFMDTEDGANLLAGYKRAANILRKEDWHGASAVTPAQAGVQRSSDGGQQLDSPLHANDENGGGNEIAHTGDEDPLENVDDPDMRDVYAAAQRDRAGRKTLSYTPEPAEKALMDALDSAEPAAARAIAAEDFAAAMSALVSLRAPIDRFFDEVTVNADEEIKRASRLDLLARFRAAVHNVADFSRIEG